MKKETRQAKKESIMKQVEEAIKSFNYDTRLTYGWLVEQTKISRWLLNTLDLKNLIDGLNDKHYFPKTYQEMRYKRRKTKNI